VKRAVLLLFIIRTICPVFASESFREPIHVARTFSVRVQDRGKPVARLRVALMTFTGIPQAEIARTTTNALGIAKFENVRTGPYYLQWGEWNIAPKEEIRVGRGHKQLIREWPCCVIEVQQIVGNVTAPKWIFADPAERIKLLASNQTAPLTGVQLELHELRTNRLVSRSEVDQLGRFRFDDVTPGIYVLHAVGGADQKLRSVEGDILLEVNPHAAPGQLSIWVNMVNAYFMATKVSAEPN
jgi:hypothetical protein